MRLRRNRLGHFVARRRNPGSLEALAGHAPPPTSSTRPRPRGRNPGPKGYAKIDAAVQAMARRERLGLRGRQGLHLKSFELGKGISRRYAVLRNGTPRPSGRYRYKGAARTLDVQRLEAMNDALFRRVRRYPGTGGHDLKLIALEKAVARRYRRAKRHGSIQNPRPRGRAKLDAIKRAMNRQAKISNRRWLALQSAHTRRILVGIKRGELKSVLNPRRRRRRNPAAVGLAGFNFLNPRRRARRKPTRKATSMARRRRRRRTAAQRAAFKRMIAGLRRFKSRRRRRRANPRRGAKHMARRRHRSRRRRAAIVMINPRRRHRRRRNPRRIRHHRRRRNPGMGGGIKAAVKSVFMTAIPALGGGFVANFIDAKWLSDKNIIVRILAKLAQAAAAGAIFRRRPVIAYATMGAIVGSVGGDFGTRMGGGAVVGGAPAAKAAGVAALITEDPHAMGVLVAGMRGMGYQIDSNVSLGDMQPLPSGSYQDVNLG